MSRRPFDSYSPLIFQLREAGHARDWLALHNLSPEVHEGITAFVEKRPVDYDVARGGQA